MPAIDDQCPILDDQCPIVNDPSTGRRRLFILFQRVLLLSTMSIIEDRSSHSSDSPVYEPVEKAVIALQNHTRRLEPSFQKELTNVPNNWTVTDVFVDFCNWCLCAHNSITGSSTYLQVLGPLLLQVDHTILVGDHEFEMVARDLEVSAFCV